MARGARDHRSDPVAHRLGAHGAGLDGRRLVEGHRPARGPARGEPRPAGGDAGTDGRGGRRRARRSRGSSIVEEGASVHRLAAAAARCTSAADCDVSGSTLGPDVSLEPGCVDPRQRDPRLDRDERRHASRACDSLTGSILGRNVRRPPRRRRRRAPPRRRRPERRRGRLSARADRRAPGARPATHRRRRGHRPAASATSRRPTPRAGTARGTCTRAGCPARVVSTRDVRRPARVPLAHPRPGVRPAQLARRLARRRVSRRTCSWPRTSSRRRCRDGTRPVLLVHDLAFLRHPGDRAAHARPLAPPFRDQLGAAAAVIVPSAATREDLARDREVDAARVHVVPLATDPARRRRRPPRSTPCASSVRDRRAVRVVRRRARAAQEPRRARRGVRRASTTDGS